LPVLRPAGQC
jgi:hypothetical protein